MKVLVINEIIPEETNIAIVDMTQELYDKLKCCHGYTVNNKHVIRRYDAEQAVLAIGHAFSKKKENIKYCETELDRELFMTFKDIAGTDEARDLSGVEKMIHCSFLL
jgi:UPF0288 family protein (methanogenesis marker protein 3)